MAASGVDGRAGFNFNPDARRSETRAGLQIPDNGPAEIDDATDEQIQEIFPDLFSVDFSLDQHRFLDRLRSDAPIHYDPSTELWLVSRYSDVLAVLTDDETFRPNNVLTAVTRLSFESLRVLASGHFSLPPSLANNGTETHPGLRRLVSSFFNGRALTERIPLMERVTDECLAEAELELDRVGSVDLAQVVARQIPIRVVLDVIGIKGLDIEQLGRWTAAALELFWGRPDRRRQAALAQDAVDFHACLADHARAGATQAQGTEAGSAATAVGAETTFMAALHAHRTPSGRPLTEDEIVAVYYFILIAGQVTTSQLLVALLRRLLTDRAAWREVAGDVGAAESWVEEVLRLDPPLTTWRRVTSRPTRLSGVQLPSDAQLLLMLAGTGRDPEVFPDPHRVCPGRSNGRRHLAFGAGRHRCLGAEFSRVETRIVLSRLAARMPNLRLVPGDPSVGPLLLTFRPYQHVLVTRAGVGSGETAGDGHTSFDAIEICEGITLSQDVDADITRCVVEVLQVDHADVVPEARLTTDLGANSLMVVELVMAIEETRHIKVTEEQMAEIRTVSDLISLVQQAC